MKKSEAIKISKANLIREYDPEIFSVDDVHYGSFVNHKEIARRLKKIVIK